MTLIESSSDELVQSIYTRWRRTIGSGSVIKRGTDFAWRFSSLESLSLSETKGGTEQEREGGNLPCNVMMFPEGKQHEAAQ